MELSKIKKIYFIGIKGVAMSGLAVICKQKGMEVYGSDVSEKFITDKILDKNQIEVFEEFSEANFNVDPELVVVGASWGLDNVEVAAAKKRNLPIITDSELRGILSKEKNTIAVTGVHGKTTTTALMSYLFTKSGLDPSYLIGTGSVSDLGANSAWHSSGKHFIVEGDEYIRSQTDKVPKFLDLDPQISIITSIEWEHVDAFANVEVLEEAFKKLAQKTKGKIIACGDWPSVKKVIQEFSDKAITYGLEAENDYSIYEIKEEFNHTSFKVKKGEDDLGIFEIKLFGTHNALNALAVIICGLENEISLENIRNTIKEFKGTERRFDVSERNGITFIDDYGHHPTAIKATLKAVAHRYADKKIWCLFQPHMASRTKAMLEELAQSFSDADKVMFADIFASAREKDQDINSRHLEESTKKYHKDAIYTGDLDQSLGYLKDKLNPEIVLITMGAGDVYRVRDQLISQQGK